MICVLRKLRVLFPCFLKIGRNFWLEFIQLRLYLFRTTWIIHILFWLFSNFWELILNSLKLPSLLICFLSFSCSLMLCRHVLTSLFYFIVRIFLFCVCLYMYVCIYTSWITYIYNVHLISYQTELCLYRVMLAVFLAVCRTNFYKYICIFFPGIILLLFINYLHFYLCLKEIGFGIFLWKKKSELN